MVVVGKGNYINTSEAYPLDKSTLRKIALRSFFVRSAFNGETGESIGWTWAMEPGLKKIHTDDEDLALSLGHNLEYNNTGSFFSTLAIGVVLSLEQQKADLETIRSVRTLISGICYSLSNIVFLTLLLPLGGYIAYNSAMNGNIVAPIVFFLLFGCLSVVLRFALMTYGYAKGTKVVEKYMHHKEAFKHSTRLVGVFMVGVLAVIVGEWIDPAFSYANAASNIQLTGILDSIVPGVVGVLITLWMYHLLTKKNYSLTKCFIILLLIGLIGGFLGVYNGISTTIITFPWMG